VEAPRKAEFALDPELAVGGWLVVSEGVPDAWLKGHILSGYVIERSEAVPARKEAPSRPSTKSQLPSLDTIRGLRREACASLVSLQAPDSQGVEKAGKSESVLLFRTDRFQLV
jgi:hypothetical protein